MSSLPCGSSSPHRVPILSAARRRTSVALSSAAGMGSLLRWLRGSVSCDDLVPWCSSRR